VVDHGLLVRCPGSVAWSVHGSDGSGLRGGRYGAFGRLKKAIALVEKLSSQAGQGAGKHLSSAP